MKIQEAVQSVNTRTFIDKKEYTNYRENLDKEFRIKGRDAYNRFVKDCFEVIAEMAVEYTGGVCIKDFMYVFMFRIPRKIKYTFLGKSSFNHHTNNYVYSISAIFPNKYPHWGVKKHSFNKTFNKKFVENLRKGEKYKVYYYSLRKGKFI